MAAKKTKAAATGTAKVRKSRTSAQPPPPAPDLVFTRDDALRTGRIPVVPGHVRTPEQLAQELSSMPADFIRTNVPPRILRREAEEMLPFRADVAVFTVREIEVTEGHFQLIATLADMLPETRAEKEEAQAAYTGFDAKEDSEAAALRVTVEKLRRLVVGNGLAEELAGLGDAEGNLRLMDAALGVVAKIKRVAPQVKPFTERDRLLKDIKVRVAGMQALRAEQAGEAGIATLSGDQLHRVKRMLLDTLRYMGNFGLYVFGDDPTRRAAYELQHVNQYRNKKRRAPAPHSVTPVPG